MREYLRRHVPMPVRVAAVTLLVAVTLLLITDRSYSSWTSMSDEDATMRHRMIELEDMRETLDLAMEFGFDPMVVQLVRRLSADAFSQRFCACPTWRFVRTEKELAYWMLSIIQIESRGDYKAFNPGGPAYGLTQLVLSTARQYDKNVQPAELLTMPKNLTIAMNHFVDLLEHYRGNHTLAILAWNRGSGGVDRSIALGQSPENGYAKAVLTQAAMRNAQ